MLLTKNFQLVELVIPANAGANRDFNFQSQPQLQSVMGDKTVFVKAVETFNNECLTLSPLTATNPVASAAELQIAVLTLNEAGTENKKQIPLGLLNRVWDTAPFTWQPFIFKDVWQIDWTKSYVTLVDAGPAQQFSFLFGVHYDYEPMIRIQQ
jgi:hypothetical protein